VRGANINHEVLGTHGRDGAVAGGRRALENVKSLRSAWPKGYRVLIHDRAMRPSDLVMADTSEYEPGAMTLRAARRARGAPRYRGKLSGAGFPLSSR